jgi:hypothetical protein
MKWMKVMLNISLNCLDDNKSYEIVEDEGVVVDSESLSSKIVFYSEIIDM